MEQTEPKNKYISLAEASGKSSYSQEYLSLRARQGKLKAKKVGRDWVTTKEWLDEYLVKVQQGAEAVKRVKTEYFSLQGAAKHSKYSQEYLSLRVRQGKLKAKKIGRNWVTTQEWLDEYEAKVKNFRERRQGGEKSIEATEETGIDKGMLRVGKGETGVNMIDRTESTNEADIKREINPSQPPFIKGGEEKIQILPNPPFLKEGITGAILKPFELLGVGFEKLADKLREGGVLLSLRWQALEEAMKVARFAPELVREELKYIRIVALSLFLAIGAGALAQENIRINLANGFAASLAKVGEFTIETSTKISGAWENIKSLPASLYGKGGEKSLPASPVSSTGQALYGKGGEKSRRVAMENFKDELKGQVKGSLRAVDEGLDETGISLAEAGSEIAWQISEAWQAATVNFSAVKKIAIDSSRQARTIITEAQAIITDENFNFDLIRIASNKVSALSEATADMAASVGQGAGNKIYEVSLEAASWPALIKDAYIDLDLKNEKAKSKFGESVLNGSLKITLAAQKFFGNFTNWPSIAYDRYLAISKQVGNAVNDTGLAIWDNVKALTRWPQKASQAITDSMDAIGGAVNDGLSFLGAKTRQAGRAIADELSFDFYRLTQYGQLERGINSIFGRIAKSSAPILTPGNQNYFSDIDSLRDEVNKLKVAMEELQFNLALKDEKQLAQTSEFPSTIIASPGGQRIIQTIQRVEKITQVLPPGDYAKNADLVALETRLTASIVASQRAAIAQNNAYTTNNFYSWAPSQRIDQLNNVSMTGATISGTLSGSFTGSINATGVLTATGGLDVSGGNLTVGGTNFTADTSGNLTITGALTVGGAQILTGNFTVNGSTILGSNTATSSLAINGPITLTVASSTTALAITQYGIAGSGLTINASSSTSTLAVYQNGSGAALDILQSSAAGNLINFRNATGSIFLIDGFGRATIGTTTASATIYGQNIITQLGDDNSLYNFYVKNFSGSNLLAINSGGNLTLNANATSSIFGDVYFDTDTLAIDSLNNRVGIGTTSPLATFSIQGTIAGQTDIFAIASSTGTNLLTVNAGGNLGIGTTTPNQLFSLYGSEIDAAISLGNSNATMWTMGADISDGSKFKIASSSALGINDRLTIDGNGNLGIGTTTPQALLNIASTLPRFYLSDTDFAANGHWFMENNAGVFSLGTTSSALAVSDTRALSITNSGNVGIASTSPYAKLAVVGNSYFTGDLYNQGNASTTGNFYAGGNFTIGGATYLGGNLLPNADNQYDLGSRAMQWHIGYFGTSAGFAGTATSSGSSLLSSGAYLIDSGSTLSVNTTNNQPVSFGTGNVNIPNASSTSFTVAGSAYLATTSGNVGIGTTSPTTKLSIQGISGANDIFNVASSTGASIFYVSAAGNVGVGTTSPSKKLAVSGALYVTSASHFGSDLQVDGALNVDGNFSVVSTVLTIDSATGNLTTNGTGWFKTDLKVDGNATTTGILNVGGALKVGGNFTLTGDTTITGTATSTGNLGTAGNFYALGHISTNGTIYASAGSQASPSYTFGGDPNTGFFSASADNLAISANGSEKVRIDASGNLGIGTTSPYWNLQVAGTRPSLTLSDTAAGANNKHWLMSSMGGNLYIGTSTDSYATSTPAALTILNSGNLGIGTTSPLYKLSIQGAAGQNIFNVASSTGTSLLTVDNTGQCVTGDTLLPVITPSNSPLSGGGEKPLNPPLQGGQTTPTPPPNAGPTGV